ncbi:MAG: acyl-CoA dehydrogenase [Chitinophagaceae bacterium]|nr:acyl-CoA dehydrogenase [Chitinophagaceae bacterium]
MQHPLHLIDEITVEAIRQQANQAEKQRRLTDQQLHIIYQNRWFNLFVPKTYGGLELSLTRALELEEAFAWIDGSFGWIITLCSGANWFIGFLSPQGRDEIFINSKTCLAGSGRASGVAKIVGNEYEVSGKWDYATGAAHATTFTANCVVETKGESQVQSFWFKPDEVEIEYNWNSMGMIATSSDTFKIPVNNGQLRVPEYRTFKIDPANTTLPHLIYKFPFDAFAECTLAVNYSGMAMHFIELFEETIIKNNKIEKYIFDPDNFGLAIKLENLLQQSKTSFEKTRNVFYQSVDDAWKELTTHSSITKNLIQQIGARSRELADASLKITQELYPYAGLVAAHPGSELNRVWRDLHTASQHTLLRFTL